MDEELYVTLYEVVIAHPCKTKLFNSFRSGSEISDAIILAPKSQDMFDIDYCPEM